MGINISFWGGRAGQVRDRNVGWWGWYSRDRGSLSRWRWHAARRGFVPWSDNTLISRFLVFIRSAGVLVIRTDKC